MTDPFSRRVFGGLSIGGMAALSGCATPDPLTQELPPMGDFRLALAIVVSENAKKIPPSRDATPGALKSQMKAEIERRFGSYGGGKDYIVAVNIDGYSLAPPGIPIVLAPKSILVISANLWTASPQEKIAGPEQITTFEGADTLLLGSGLVKDADEQLATLTRNATSKIQTWLLKNPGLIGLPA